MHRTTNPRLGILGLLLGLCPQVASAGAPLVLTHHGYLTMGGSPVVGDVAIAFRLYDAASDTLPFWEETLNVSVDQGYYSVVLGLTQPLDPALVASAPDPRLGISIGAGTELTPRLRVTSVPYALVADQAARAADLECSGCVGAPEVGFTYAGSGTQGGPAQDLDCAAVCVSTAELDNAAVTTAKLADGAVSTAKLSDGAVTLTKLAACTANQVLRVTSAGAWQCTSALTITDAGLVGIGTGAPVAQLELADIYGAGGRNLQIGDDAYLSDMDTAHTLGVLSVNDSTRGRLRLGSAGAALSGVGGTLTVEGPLTVSGAVNSGAINATGNIGATGTLNAAALTVAGSATLPNSISGSAASLTADGSDCGASNYARGMDCFGNAQGCSLGAASYWVTVNDINNGGGPCVGCNGGDLTWRITCATRWCRSAGHQGGLVSEYAGCALGDAVLVDCF